MTTEIKETAETAAGEVGPYAGPWFDSPFFDRQLADSDLDAAERTQVERFAEDGYLVLEPDALGVADAEELFDEVIADVEPLYGDASRVQDAWVVSDAVHRLALAPGVIALVERLYRREAIPFQTLNFRLGTQPAVYNRPHSAPVAELVDAQG